jgi:hypothetical protein
MFNSGEKSSAETPTYTITAPTNEMSGGQNPRGVQKKHVLIAVSAVVIVGMVIAAILVGMYMFSEANKEIVKFSLQFKSSDNENANQDVVSDPNDNVVMFHISKPGQDVYVVNDFNKDLQVVKIETEEGTNCYISPLNRSQAMDPSHITDANSLTGTGGEVEQTFILSTTPVKDTTFMTKKARDMCAGVSTYWAYRHCGQKVPQDQNVTRSVSHDRNKRALYHFAPVNGLPGLGGCCNIRWACHVSIVETVYASGVHHCQFYVTTGTCCSSTPYCWYVYSGTWQTPGLICQ